MVGMFYGDSKTPSFSVFGPSLPFAAFDGTAVSGPPINVRYWHKADICVATHMSAFGRKADMALNDQNVRFRKSVIIR